MKIKGFMLFVIIILLILVGALSYLNFFHAAEATTAVISNLVSGNAGDTPQKSTSPEKDSSADKPSIEGTKHIKIVAVGDILLGRGVKYYIEKQKQRYIYPFTQVAGILKQGDVVFGNLEEPITSSAKSLTDIDHGGKIVLKNDIEAIKGLNYAGFNLLSLANNHILDYYDKGLFDTIKILDKNNIAHAGAAKNLSEARKLAIVEKNGLKIGMLAYTDMAYITYKGNPMLSFSADKNKAGVAPNVSKYIYNDIKSARSKVDILIVSLHWGVENSFNTTPEQTKFAHVLIDKGVDIILGHHPHRFQGVEIYKGKPIVYSLGNFLFDQNLPENQEGFILNMEIESKKLSGMNAIPISILNKSHIVIQKGRDANNILQRELELCKNLKTKCKIKNGKIVFDL
jgi:poly-gamma-glutamate synthesis protein (capsule biosynthesis protein)